jgi:signal transduction histidine kinase
MGSFRRSIRVSIYLLVTIPLIALIGVFSYTTTTTVNNAVNLDRASSLIETTSVGTATFVSYLQSECTAAVVYLSAPTAANLKLYEQAMAATDAAKPAFETAVTSSATRGAESSSEAAGIATIISDLGQLPELRQGVEGRALTPMQAFGLYTQGVAAEPKLFLNAVSGLNDAVASFQAVGLVDAVEAASDLEEEDALLSGILADTADGSLHEATSAQRAAFAQERIEFTQLAGARRSEMFDATAMLSPANLAVYNDRVNAAAPAAQQNELTTIEDAVAADTGDSSLPVTLTQWRRTASTLELAYFNAGVATAEAELAADHQTTHADRVRVVETSVGGVLGLLLTILVSALVGRGIIRRLAGLRRSALALAEQQLPTVVSKLQQGASVDIEAEAPPIRGGSDEIGQVGQAFDSVRQTAIRAALEEARIRQSVNDVFRNLARRNQSLLHRQLTMLDDMERRVTDPEALADLFRLDHLTTRMRRHAEGLIILSGGSTNRSWSSPVRLIDVMRGALAEVEDYARVSVTSRSEAGLSGPAVTGVIHLLAELIENATTLSPPDTEVSLSGRMVANGFAIDIEDHGLGMTEQRLAELNERLANPTDFNPANSEQLGLFVVGQLIRRHGIAVTLRPSPYGGTTAIVLIPAHLVVRDNQMPAGVPSAPAELTSGQAHGTTGPGAMSGPGPSGDRSSADARSRDGQPGDGQPGDGQPGDGQPGDGQSTEVPSDRSFASIRISGAIRRQSHSDSLGNGGRHRAHRPGMQGSPPPQVRRVDDRLSGEQSRQPTANLTPANGNGSDGAAPAAQGPASGAKHYKGLPRRTRQASIAPQLHNPSDPPGASRSSRDAPSPSDIQQRMSAMQQGWQRGRSALNPNMAGEIDGA